MCQKIIKINNVKTETIRNKLYPVRFPNALWHPKLICGFDISDVRMVTARMAEKDAESAQDAQLLPGIEHQTLCHG